MDDLKLISGNANRGLASDISSHIGTPLCDAEVSAFPDSETKVRIMEDVRGTDVFVIQPTCFPVNQNLMELLVICDALMRASAERITAVIPYYGYARQDRKHEGRVPITAKLVANLIVAAGASRILTVDLHSTQIQGFFDIPADHLYAAPVLVGHLKEVCSENAVVMAPDAGGMKMANAYAKRLGASLALVEKRRAGDDRVERGHIVGDVAGKEVVIVDDMITTAGTLVQAIEAAREAGASSVRAAATHPVMCSLAVERLKSAECEEIVVTDTIPLRPETKELDLKVLSVAPLLAEAITRIHRHESLSSLFLEKV